MSNIIPPLLSNTPPPIIGAIEDDDEDDDFCDFRAATDLSFEHEGPSFSDSSPGDSPKISLPQNSVDINSNNDKLDSVLNVINQKQTDDDCDVIPNFVKNSDFHDCEDNNYEVLNLHCDLDIKPTSGGNFSEIINDGSDSGSQQYKNDDANFEDCIDDGDDFGEFSTAIKDIPNQEEVDTNNIDDEILNNLPVDEFSDISQTTLPEINYFSPATESIVTSHVSKQEDLSKSLTDLSITKDENEFPSFSLNESDATVKSNFPLFNQTTNSVSDEFSSESLKELTVEESIPIDDFAEFHAASFEDSKNVEAPSKKIEFYTAPFEENNTVGFTPVPFGDESKTVPNTNLPEDDDDFGDFATVQTPKEETKDEFGDFANFPEDVQLDKTVILVIDKQEAFEKTINIVKDIFPELKNDVEDYVDGKVEKNDRIFNELKDITESNALLYQWSKSTCQEMFLKALNIDTRNILYGPSWSSSMPRFAANLGLAPLQPQKSDILTPTPMQPSPTTNKPQPPTVEIPNVEFDWSGAGLVNPLEETHQKEPDFVEPPTNFVLQPQILTPTDTSSTNFKNVDDFDDFTSYSDNMTWNSPTSLPLRETHISSSSMSKTELLEPTIQTTDLPKQDFVVDDDFDDFQMVVPERVEEKSPKEQEDDEFTDFYSSQLPTPPVIEPLTPAIVHSNKIVETSTTSLDGTIVWPAPGGITDEDIKQFELNYTRIQKKVEQLPSPPEIKQKQNSVEEDEWSDFVSVSQSTLIQNKLIMSDRTASPDLPLSVLNLSNVQSPKRSIPVITPQGLVQTKLSSYKNSPEHINKKSLDDDDWSDFVSSPAVTQSNGWKSSVSTSGKNWVNQNGDNKKIVVQTKKNTIPSISSLPDLDFVSPRIRTNYRK